MHLMTIGGYSINPHKIKYMYPNVGNSRVNIVFGNDVIVHVDGSIQEITQMVNDFVEDR